MAFPPITGYLDCEAAFFSAPTAPAEPTNWRVTKSQIQSHLWQVAVVLSQGESRPHIRARVNKSANKTRAKTPAINPPIIPQDEIGKRRFEILKVASRLFANHGYEGVSIRGIADAAGILSASLYHHFSSKQELYIEAHDTALETALMHMRNEISLTNDPWKRLEGACRRHLEIRATPDSVHHLHYPMTYDASALNGDMRTHLVKARDAFESIYKELVKDLPLRPDVDRSVFRLALVSMIHSSSEWYKPGGHTAEDLAREVIAIFRASSGLRSSS